METLAFATDVARSNSALTSWLLLWVVKGSLLLAVLFPLSALMRRAASSTRHLIWTAGLAIVVTLPLLSGLLPWRVELPAAVASLLAKPEPSDAGILPNAAEPAQSQAASFTAGTDDPRAPHSSVQPLDDSRAPIVSASVRQRWGRAQLVNTLLLVWLTGAALLLFRLWLSRLRVRRLVNGGTPLTDPSWTTPLIEVADRLDLPDLPRLVVNADAAMPLTCGVTRPAIVLPPEAAAWTDERRRAVLCHELAHVRRRDLMSHLLGRVACALYWFQPLVWSAARRLRAESERACDDLVLITGTRPSTYADHLLQIVTSVRRASAPLVALPMAQPREFEARLLSILEPGKRREPLSRLHATSLLLLVIVIALPLVALTPAPPTGQAPVPGAVVSDDDDADDIDSELLIQQPVAGERPSAAANPTPSAEPDTQFPRRHRLSESVERGAEQVAHEIVDFTLSTLTSAFKSATGQDQSQDPRVRAALIRALADSSARVARTAAWALASHPDTAVVRALNGAARSAADASVREMAIWALVQHGTRSMSPTTHETLAQSLQRDQNADVRGIAAWGLGNARDPAALPALERTVRSDADAEVRRTAAWALGQIAAASSVPALNEALTFNDADVRQVAAWSLGQIAQRPAAPNLVAALRDADADVRHVAAWSLGRIGDPAAAGALRAAIADADTNVRRAAIWAIGKLQGADAIDALTAALSDKDPEVRAAAAAALGGRGSDPWPWPWPWPMPRISP